MCQGSRRNSASRCEGSAGKPSLPSITSISCKMGGKPPHFTHAPPLLRKAEAAAAPRWEPKVPRGLVAPAQSAKARLLRQKLIAVCFLRKPRPTGRAGRYDFNQGLRPLITPWNGSRAGIPARYAGCNLRAAGRGRKAAREDWEKAVRLRPPAPAGRT